MDVELFKSCITNYSTAKLNTYVYGTHDNLLEVEDIPKYMNEFFRRHLPNIRINYPLPLMEIPDDGLRRYRT